MTSRELTKLEKSKEFTSIRKRIEANLLDIFRKCKREYEDVTVASIFTIFYKSHDLISTNWKLGPILSTRFFGRLDPADRVGRRFISKLKDFIAAICVIDHIEMMITMTELFRTFSVNMDVNRIRDETKIPLSNVLKMLHAVYGTNNRRNDTEIDAHVRLFKEFISCGVNVNVNDKDLMVPCDAVVTFFAKIHPNSLWPLIFFRSKLRNSFLTETFIERILIGRQSGSGRKQQDHFSILQFIDKLNAYGEDDEGNESKNDVEMNKLKRTKIEDSKEMFLNFLIIEDSIVQRKMITKKLKLIGGHSAVTFEDRWHFQEVDSGENAMQLLGDSDSLFQPTYDVIIVDENLLGEMKGHEVVQNLKSRGQYNSSVIVGCTMNLKKNASLMYGAGADTVWGKPIPDPSALISQLEALLLSRKNRFAEGILTNNFGLEECKMDGIHTPTPMIANIEMLRKQDASFRSTC